MLTIEDGRLTAAETDSGAMPMDASPPCCAVAGPATRGTVRPIVRKELMDALQNRWLAAFAILLGILGLAATASGYDSVSGLGLQMFGRTTATLLNLSLLLAPLVAVLMGAASIAGERERGTLEHLLALPLSRTAFLLGKHTGLVIALAAATAAGFLPAGVLIAANSGFGMLPHYALFPALAVGAGAALAGVRLVISVSSRSAVQAQGTAVAVWFTLAISGLAPHWLVAALAANPIDATRVIGVLALEPDLYLLGPAGAFLTEQLGVAGAATVLALAVVTWIALPIAAAAVRFSWAFRRRQSDDTGKTRTRDHSSAARWNHRLRFRRAGN